MNEFVHFSRAYAYAYVDPVSHAYTHVLGCLCLCLCLCDSENQALEIGAASLAVIEIALPQPFLCLNRCPIQYDFCGRPKAIYYCVSIALGYLPLGKVHLI